MRVLVLLPLAREVALLLVRRVSRHEQVPQAGATKPDAPAHRLASARLRAIEGFECHCGLEAASHAKVSIAETVERATQIYGVSLLALIPDNVQLLH